MRETVWIGRLVEAEAQAAFARALGRVPPRPRRDVTHIAIKVNLCDYRRPESGAVTDPALVAAMVGALRERWPRARVSILENDATTLDVWMAYRVAGFDTMAAALGVELVNVAEGAWVTRTVPNPLVLKELEVPEILEACDLYINFAKLKTNALTKTTGCLKNQFAFLRQKRKVVLHGKIDEVLHDMNQVLVADWSVIDGLVGMEGMGPAFGHPRRCELLIAGTNAVAVDACEARVMGFWPRGVKHLKLCHNAGLGPLDYRLETDVPGFDYARYHFEFGHLEYHLKNALRSRVGMAT